MATDKKIAAKVVTQLEKSLRDLNIKFETETSKDETLIYGKFALEKDKYQIVIHITNEGFSPRTHNTGLSKIDTKDSDGPIITPNFNFQSMQTTRKRYTEKEGLEIKKRVLDEAAKLITKLEH